MKIMKFPGDPPAMYTFLLQVIGWLPLTLAKILKTRSRQRSKAHEASGFRFLAETSTRNEGLLLSTPGTVEFTYRTSLVQGYDLKGDVQSDILIRLIQT